MAGEFALELIDGLSKIGRTEFDGSDKVGFTKYDIEGRNYLMSQIEAIGLEYRVDAFGNIIATYNPNNSSLPAVATGSHIDTVPNGGHYDGILGVALSLSAIKEIKEAGIELKRPLELITFQLEESARFGHATMGSKVMTGMNVFEKYRDLKDKDGVSLGEAMAESRLDISKLEDAIRGKDEIYAFIEAHIDQSIDLYDEDYALGIVTSIAAPKRYRMTITGEPAHSGATRMKYRKDALLPTAEIILLIKDLALEYADRDVVATCGDVKVFPGAMAVVPGKTEFLVDLRASSREHRDVVAKTIEEESKKIAAKYNTTIDIAILSDEDPIPVDKGVYETIEKTADKLGIKMYPMFSAAGHDAMNMANIAKMGMIFVRNPSGTSHSPEECVQDEDIKTAATLLKETIIELANQ